MSSESKVESSDSEQMSKGGEEKEVDAAEKLTSSNEGDNEISDQQDDAEQENKSGLSGEQLFNRGRQELRRWAYTNHAIENTLDTGLIEGRGRQLLYQSLSHGTTTAFIGSGVSQAYGRLSWRDWLDAQFGFIDEVATAFIDCADKRQKWLTAFKIVLKPRGDQGAEKKQLYDNYISTIEAKFNASSYRYQEVLRLYKIFKSARDGTASIGGESPPINFQIAQQLHEQLQEAVNYIVPFEVGNDFDSLEWFWKGIIVKQPNEEDINIEKPFKPLPDYDVDDLQSSFCEKIKLNLGSLELEIVDKEEILKTVCGTAHEYAKSILKLKKRTGQPEFTYAFSDVAKLLLVDEVAHAESCLSEAILCKAETGREKLSSSDEKIQKLHGHLEKNKKAFDKKGLRRDREIFKRIPDGISRFEILGYFKTDSIWKLLTKNEALPESFDREVFKNNLADAFSENTGEILKSWQDAIYLVAEANRDNSDRTFGKRASIDRTFISPVHRFVVPMLVSLLEDPSELSIEDGDQLNLKFFTPVSQDDFLGRKSIIDEELDPLNSLASSLGIRRYLTTNYDFEIERLYADHNYRRFHPMPKDKKDEPLREAMPTDATGGFVEDSSFTRQRATDLINFTLDNNGADARIFHLHGRATTSSRLVITERDYMDQYVARDKYRSTVDESIRLAFSGNPILFVGLGMDEVDVLRPLREFMSDRDAASNRTAVALFAAIDEEINRSQIAATLYLRYGVHTVFYGAGAIDYVYKEHNSEDNENDEIIGFDWLFNVVKLIDLLKARTKSWMDPLVELLKEYEKAFPKSGGTKPTHWNEKLNDCKAIQKILRQWDSPDNPYLSYEKPQIALREICGDLGQAEIKYKHNELEIPLESVPEKASVFNLLFKLDLATDFTKDDEWENIANDDLEIAECGLKGDRSQEATAKARPIGKTGDRLKFERKLLGFITKLDINGLPISNFPEAFGSTEQPIECAKKIFNGSCVAIWKQENKEKFVKNIRMLIRDGRARLIALEGVKSSIITGCLTEALDVLVADWDHWRERWKACPPHRLARFALKTKTPKSQDYLPLVYSRHEVSSVITDLSKCTKVVDPGTWIDKSNPVVTSIRAFDEFLLSVQNQSEIELKSDHKEGRSIRLILAERGLGKGSLIAALSTNLGLSQYIACSQPKKSTGDSLANWATEYVSALFINLSFSTEIASVYDGLIDVLVNHYSILNLIHTDLKKASGQIDLGKYLAIVQKAKKDVTTSIREQNPNENQSDNPRKNIWETVAPMPRLDAMRYLFTECMDLSISIRDLGGEKCRGFIAAPRLILAFSAIELFFDKNQTPKNREIYGFLKILINEKWKSFPIDVLFFGTESGIGYPLLQQQDTAKPHKTNSAVSKLTYALLSYDDSKERYEPEDNEWEQKNKNAVRLAQEKHLIGTAFFPADYTSDQNPSSNENICEVHFAREMAPERFLIDNFLVLAALLYMKWALSFMRRYVDENPDSADAKNVLHAVQKEIHEFEVSWNSYDKKKNVFFSYEDQSLENLIDDHGLLTPEMITLVKMTICEINKLLTGTEAECEDAKEDHYKILIHRYSQDVSSFREWRDIRSSLRGSRFCMTVMLSAARRLALSQRTVDDAVRLAETFLRRTTDEVSRRSKNDREEAVLREVFKVYDMFSIVGVPQSDTDLHDLILRHLAIIGTPTSLDVLVRAPYIRDYFDKNSDESRPRTRKLMEAVTSLARRGLVFRILPHPRLKFLHDVLEKEQGDGSERQEELFAGRQPQHEYRYALHRSVQMHIIRKMGAQPLEFGEINNYAPTLFASMPSDVPKLDKTTFTFLGELVASFSQYPEPMFGGRSANAVAFAKASLSTRVQALRAAMSIIRSAFSVAAVSHFDDMANNQDENRRMGFLESYRIQLRWIIRKAWELLNLESQKDFSFADYNPSKPDGHNQINALYRDEIVWLYNECGLVCLVQGNVKDAVPLLSQAVSINGSIEGTSEAGSMHNRLLLNVAIAQIELGELDEAQRLLHSIFKVEASSACTDQLVKSLAQGYLGLVSHLSGEYRLAQKHYRKAIGKLQELGDHRGSAIFCRHYGNILNHEGHWKKARRYLKLSSGYAASGGHEDEHFQTKLALLKWKSSNAEKNNLSLNLREQFTGLDEIEAFASVMSMHGLMVSALVHRASLLVTHGEPDPAGELVIRALGIATKYKINLRLNRGMTTYARILKERDSHEEAVRLLEYSLSMAKSCRNDPEIQHILGLRSSVSNL